MDTGSHKSMPSICTYVYEMYVKWLHEVAAYRLLRLITVLVLTGILKGSSSAQNVTTNRSFFKKYFSFIFEKKRKGKYRRRAMYQFN